MQKEEKILEVSREMRKPFSYMRYSKFNDKVEFELSLNIGVQVTNVS